MKSKLQIFLKEKMKMTGPYQPMIIKHLLLGDGAASIDSIAEELSARDKDSLEYYKSKLKIYPKAVLSKHQIAKLEKSKYLLVEDLFEKDQKDKLIEICESRLKEFYASKKVEVDNDGWGRKRILLLEQNRSCTLCGARPSNTNDIELDIDHILPKSKGGSDDLENLQVLCHKCNRAKGNYLLKASKEIKEKMLSRKSGCPFCEVANDREILFENEYIKAFHDKYPVSEGHAIVIPVRHVESALELNSTEIAHIFTFFQKHSAGLKKEDKTIRGFNAGFNIGEVAGQTIFHAHFHIIPRRKGDVKEPRGGIRGVIPEKKSY